MLVDVKHTLEHILGLVLLYFYYELTFTCWTRHGCKVERSRIPGLSRVSICFPISPVSLFTTRTAAKRSVEAAEAKRPLMHLRVPFYLVKQKKRQAYAGKGKQSSSSSGPWQRDDSSRWILLVLLSCTDLAASGGCHTHTHTEQCSVTLLSYSHLNCLHISLLTPV